MKFFFLILVTNIRNADVILLYIIKMNIVQLESYTISENTCRLNVIFHRYKNTK